MSADDIKLPDPAGHYYEWDGPYGKRKFSVAPHNGRQCDRAVAYYTADQVRAAILADRVSRAAPSPQGDAEDTARIDFIAMAYEGAIRIDDELGLVPRYLYWGHHHKTTGINAHGNVFAPTLREAIDAARSTPATEKGE